MSPRSRRAAPRTEVVLERAVPAWALRGALAVVVLGTGLLMTSGAAASAVTAVLAALVAWRPQAPLLALATGLAAVLLLVVGDGTVDLRVHALVLVVPVLLRLAVLAEPLPWNGVVDRVVLLRAARSVLLVQVPAQLLAVLARHLPDLGVAPWLGVAAVGAVGVLGWVLLRPPPGPR